MALFSMQLKFITRDDGSKLKLFALSMDMSSDYEAAIVAGAAILRLGTAVFGLR